MITEDCSAHTKTRIDKLKQTALYAEEGSCFFLEVSSYPVVSVVVLTGPKEVNTSKKHQLHLQYVVEPTEYSAFKKIGDSDDHYGYAIYNDFNQVQDMTEVIFRTKYNSICQDINKAIHKNHGVQCYEDGDSKNLLTTNVIYIHICDVINIMVDKKKYNKQPEVVVKTTLLRTIESTLINDYEINYLKKEDIEFFFMYADLIYITYAYWNNHSFIPIRTGIDNNSQIFEKSSFFINNDHFLGHQFGKVQEFNQNNDLVTSKMVYRSI